MQRIKMPMLRYGEADFDRNYLTWGFHDPKTQIEEAESVLKIVGSPRPLLILDLACGIGTHAVSWAKEGHHVTAVDKSEVFIEEGRKRAEMADVNVIFEVGDIKNLDCRGCFDLVTWIERSFFDAEAVAAAHRYLRDGGWFIFDARNPEHPRMKERASNWRTWREENGVFYLEKHETDESSETRSSVWIEIDPANDRILEKTEVVDIPKQGHLDVLRAVGFKDCEYRTMAGDKFDGGEEPYWLWGVGRK